MLKYRPVSGLYDKRLITPGAELRLGKQTPVINRSGFIVQAIGAGGKGADQTQQTATRFFQESEKFPVGSLVREKLTRGGSISDFVG